MSTDALLTPDDLLVFLDSLRRERPHVLRGGGEMVRAACEAGLCTWGQHSVVTEWLKQLLRDGYVQITKPEHSTTPEWVGLRDEDVFGTHEIVVTKSGRDEVRQIDRERGRIAIRRLSRPSGDVAATLSEAATLVDTAGAPAAVDRVLTALAGYLRQQCAELGVTTDEKDTLVGLLKKLIASTGIAGAGPRPNDTKTVLRSCGATLDAMAPIRNRATRAHPVPELLDEADARLVIDAALAILYYVDARLGATGQSIQT